MGKISLDLTSIKAAGVYTIEIDNSVRTTTTTNSLRLIPGFSNKGPFNRPVFLQNDNDRLTIFGDVDTKLEHKGCYFNRMMRTLLQDGPIIALNLLSVDNNYNGPDQVNFAALSLDAASPNPRVGGSHKFGEYDYHANTIDKEIYGTEAGDMIPYVGNTPFSSLYNRSRFWIPDKDLLTSVAAKNLNSIDFGTGSGSYEHTNFLNFANVGTEEFSILVFKPENIIGYDITAESWYGSVENIPYGWIRPSDYISDYFLQVVCVKGNWSNYPVLSTDPMWKAYFDKNGIIKSRINNFITAEGVQLIGSWMGCIIPDFINKQGDNLSLELKINARTEITGLLMSFNEDAAHVVSGDFTGADVNENDSDFDNSGTFTWGIDIDGDHEIDGINGEGKAPYIVDMVGHGAFADDDEALLNALVYEHLGNECHVKTSHENVNLVNLVCTGLSHDTLESVNVSCVLDSNNKLKAAEATDENAFELKLSTNGVYITDDFFNLIDRGTLFTMDYIRKVIVGSTYYYLVKEDDGKYKLESSTIKGSKVSVVYYDIDANGELITDIKQVPAGFTEDLITAAHTLKLAFTINTNTYFAFFRYHISKDKSSSKIKFESFEPGVATDAAFTQASMSVHEWSNSHFSQLELEADENGKINIVIKEPESPDDCSDISPNLHYIITPSDQNGDLINDIKEKPHTIGFLSYAFIENKDEVNVDNMPVYLVEGAHYFGDTTLWIDGVAPVTDINKNMFIIPNAGTEAQNDGWNAINVGTLVRNITYMNNPGEANTYKVIPGVTRVIRKQFVPVNLIDGAVNYQGKTYYYNGDGDVAKNGAYGFYLYTTIDPVLIEEKVDVNSDKKDEKITYITRQLPLTSSVISNTLRFIPMKGLKITSRHRPGYAADGTISIEGGIEKIYSVLTDAGIRRGLCNPTMVDYRYIVDSMSYGLENSMGGKVYLTQLALDRGSCLAVLNLPSAKQFAVSSNPVFCDSYTTGAETRPSFDTKYIPQGGNQEMGSSRIFSLPDENDGSKYAAAFFPHLIYSEGGRKFPVPPAADVCNVLASKFTGVNSPYGICANMNGIIRNRYVYGIEFDADTDDRGYLEPFGVNTIIKEQGNIMIYGNQTCYQTLKSDMNKLHVRENLNTIEIECNAVLKRFNFLYNTAQTRAAVVQALTPILSVMQVSGAIDSFTITCDESNNTPEIIEEDFGIVDIDVWFNHGMEKILTRIKINRYASASTQQDQ